jgi:hypothetical protein
MTMKAERFAGHHEAREALVLVPHTCRHRWLKQQAKRNNRSLNQEVEARLLKGRETEEAKPLLDELRALLTEAKLVAEAVEED